MDRELKQIAIVLVLTLLLLIVAVQRGRGNEVSYVRGADNVFRATQTIPVGTNNPRFPVIRAVGETVGAVGRTAATVARVPGRVLCPT